MPFRSFLATPRASRRVAVVVSAIVVASITTGHGGLAQSLPPEPSPLQAQAGRTASFDIPAQPLAQALTAFGRQSGLQVAVNAAGVAGKTSRAVTGTMTAEQALQLLLAGTGVSYRFTSPNAVTVASPGDAGAGALQLDPVRVQGSNASALIGNVPPPYAGGQVATGGQVGVLGNRDVMDTPFNQTSFTAKKVQDQQAKTIRDVLIDDPSVRPYFPDGGIGNDELKIRGFTVAAASTAYNGLFGVLPYSTIMPELAERIEVLKGPSTLLFGMAPQSTIGGTVNVVPKRAPEQPLTQLTATYSSSSQFGGHADIARRFGSDNQFGVRFNGVFRGGQTEIVGNSDQRALGAFGVDFRGERVRVAADFGYQYQYVGGMVPYLGLANNVPLPWAPNARKNWGQPWGYVDRRDLFGMVRGEVDLTDRLMLYAAYGAHDFRLGILSGGPIVTASNINGMATATPSNISQYYQFTTAEAGIRATADTGPIGHEVAIAGNTLGLSTGIATVNGTAYATNFYNVNLIPRQNIPTGAANKTGTMTLNSLALADTLSAADKRIQLTLGARLQQIVSSNFNVTSGALTTYYEQSVWSPSVALVVKPLRNVSLYGNFIQGLLPGVVVGSTFANAGEILPPFVSTQYEGGIKIDWGRFTTTASVFQISQPSTITDVTANRLLLAGEQINRGIELDVFGEIAEGVRLLGGVMFLDAKLTRTQGGLTDNWIAPFSPTAQFNIGGEWDLPFVPGLTLNGRVVYTGQQYIDTTSPRRALPEWTRVDVGARYVLEGVRSPTGKPAALRFSVENLFDTNYWATGFAAVTLSLGQPRTFRLALTADF